MMPRIHQHTLTWPLAVFAVMLAVSWRRWVSIIADSGRELDLPLRLSNGETLYRDIHYLYTPLAAQVNAQLYQWFGARLETLQVSGVICSLLVVWFCYRIARHLLSPAASTLAACSIIIFCVFKPAGNLISPYSYSALYGMLFSLACLLTCLHSLRQRDSRWLALSGGFFALAVLSKQEFALVAGAAIWATVYLVLHQADFEEREIRARDVGQDTILPYIPRHSRDGVSGGAHKLFRTLRSPVLGIMPLSVIAGWWFVTRYDWDLLVNDCHLLFTNLPASLRFYNAHRTGLNAPLASLLQMLGGAGVAVTVACAIAWFSVKAAPSLKRRALLIGLAALSFALLIGFVSRGQWDGSPLRALPLLLLVLLWQARKQTNQGALFIIAAYSLAALLRVMLRVPSGGAFGSFFLPTSLTLLVYVLLRVLPDAIARWSNESDAVTRAQRFGWALLVTALVCTAVVFGIRYRRTYSHLIETARGTFYAPRDAGAAYGEALRWLQQNTRTDEAVAVFPEGSDLAFFSERRMPLRHQIYIPGLVSERDETRVIEQLRELRYVLIVNRPMREFGATAFGQDFYQRLGQALAEQYRVVQICGAPNEPDIAIGDQRFFIKILERKTP
ncbi:MAG: hypothetical protein HOP19_06660 [Acidobacteria bacterium]|nr:hypothetical protein [Acidobacteriota bacterium]